MPLGLYIVSNSIVFLPFVLCVHKHCFLCIKQPAELQKHQECTTIRHFETPLGASIASKYIWNDAAVYVDSLGCTPIEHYQSVASMNRHVMGLSQQITLSSGVDRARFLCSTMHVKKQMQLLIRYRHRTVIVMKCDTLRYIPTLSIIWRNLHIVLQQI